MRHRSIWFNCFVFSLIVLLPLRAHAVWYALPSSKGGDAARCVDTERKFTVSLQALEGQNKLKCQLDRKGAYEKYDFPVQCSNNSRHYFFLYRDQCEVFTHYRIQKQPIVQETLAPPRVSKPGAWAQARLVCWRKAEAEHPVLPAQFEQQAQACECTASVRGNARTPLSDEEEINLQRLCRISQELAIVSSAPGGTGKKIEALENPEIDERIMKGSTYESVMRRLAKFHAKSFPLSDMVFKEYRHPSLLAYPDAGGTCNLTFMKGKLTGCAGCSEKVFDCD